MSPQSGPEDRNRTHPKTRFADPVQSFDLNELTEQIKEEPLSEEHLRQGHRQIALIRDLPQTIALYYFEEGGYLTEHEVDGVVSIQVLEGRIEVETRDGSHDLTAGNVLVLRGRVPHRLEAHDESRMLLTISHNKS